MLREQVFAILDQERRYQDETWPSHDGHKTSEHTLVLVRGYLRKAENAWIGSVRRTTSQSFSNSRRSLQSSCGHLNKFPRRTP